ncbi:MAG TPA: hypothetical protein VFU36_13785 [Jatrophihabitans sp.]|nr:hypothetical protein [Jatrophihabitans sp.]
MLAGSLRPAHRVATGSPDAGRATTYRMHVGVMGTHLVNSQLMPRYLKVAFWMVLVALGIELCSLVLVRTASVLLHDVNLQTSIDGSYVVNSIADATNQAGAMVNGAGAIVLAVVFVLLITGAIVDRSGRPKASVRQEDRFKRSLDELVDHLAALERDYVGTKSALAEAEAERKRNEELISLTRDQAGAVREEWQRTLTASSQRANKLSVTLFIASTVAAVAIAIITYRLQ